MNKYIKALVGLGMAGLLFIGCTDVSSEELLSAPNSGITKENIKEIVSRDLGSNIVLNIPKNMSASILKEDFDKDNYEELFLFYENKDTQKLGLALIDMVDGKEKVISKIEFDAHQFDDVYIQDLDNDKKIEVILGTSLGDTMPKAVALYTLENNNFSEVYKNVYEAIAVADIDNDSSKELLIITRDDQSFVNKLSALKIDSSEKKLTTMAEAEVDYGTVMKLDYGYANDSMKGIFVDTIVGTRAGSTNLLIYEDGTLKQPLLEKDENWDLLWNIFAVKTEDKNKDGIIELVQITPFNTVSNDEPLNYKLTWSHYDGAGGLKRVLETYSNNKAGYELTFKDGLDDNISIKVSSDDNNSIIDTFYTITDTVENEIFNIISSVDRVEGMEPIKAFNNRFYYIKVLDTELFERYGFGIDVLKENLDEKK